MHSLFLLCSLVAGLISHNQAPLFADHYAVADQLLSEMTLDEKIAQTLLVRYPDDATAASILEKYQFGGYIFFAKDFQGKSAVEVSQMTESLQKVAKVPILTAVDEEGGLVARVSSNQKLRKERFASPRELYAAGGLPLTREDTLEKSRLLSSLGLNLNLAPVVDVSTNPADYMYSRSLGEDAKITSEFARTVIDASRTFNSELTSENHEASTVSYTLKHFPGYGNNLDTHQGTSLDRRSLVDLLSIDLQPFRAGLIAGAEAVLVSHNIVTALDSARPASLSPVVHELLTNVLGFTGVIITDDIAMGAIANPAAASSQNLANPSSENSADPESLQVLSENPAVQAVLAGNHLIVTTDYLNSLTAIKSALQRGVFDEAQIDRMARQILAWKSYKGLF